MWPTLRCHTQRLRDARGCREAVRHARHAVLPGHRQAEAVRQAVAYGNKIFSLALAKLVNKDVASPDPKGGLPLGKNSSSVASSTSNQTPRQGVKSPQELSAYRDSIIKNIGSGGN